MINQDAREIDLAPPDPEPPKYPLELARKTARTYLGMLGPYVDRILIVGSVRRERPLVKDIEIMYIPKMGQAAAFDMFQEKSVNLLDQALDRLLQEGILTKRPNRRGFCAWGGYNKLGRDLRTGIPIDFFSATPATWWNYLVCRTGGMKSNIAICEAARAKGWKWNPYGEGFTHQDDPARTYRVKDERDAFTFVKLPYKEPKERE